jgi:hypothetical protein
MEIEDAKIVEDTCKDEPYEEQPKPKTRVIKVKLIPAALYEIIKIYLDSRPFGEVSNFADNFAKARDGEVTIPVPDDKIAE